MTTALEGGEGSAARPGRTLPLGKTWYPLYRRLGGTGINNNNTMNLDGILDIFGSKSLMNYYCIYGCIVVLIPTDRLIQWSMCKQSMWSNGLVVRVSGYRYRGLGFDSQRYQIF